MLRTRASLVMVAASLLVVCVPCVVGAQRVPIIVGVLEDSPGVYAGDLHYRSVRVVFYKRGADWKAFPNDCGDKECLQAVASGFPTSMKWTIAFDGREVGTVTSHAPDRFDHHSSIGQQHILDEQSAPKVGQPSRKFAGWLSASVYRPLVANSAPYFKDPELWKPSHLSDTVVALLRKEFRQKFPSVNNCNTPDEDAKPWIYRDDDIKVMAAYTSRENWSVARLELGEYRCDGPADDPFVDQWFAVSPSGEVKWFGKAMWLVDAGDYDNDGRSELVFSVDDYDLGGYRLFYEHFEKHVSFEFSYH